MKKLIPKILLSIMLSTAMVASVKFGPIRTPRSPSNDIGILPQYEFPRDL
ncbi:hypothetical protein [Lactobacillus crispatus]|nr:hypothetical protein [Lactobacillus crispatus]